MIPDAPSPGPPVGRLNGHPLYHLCPGRKECSSRTPWCSQTGIPTEVEGPELAYSSKVPQVTVLIIYGHVPPLLGPLITPFHPHFLSRKTFDLSPPGTQVMTLQVSDWQTWGLGRWAVFQSPAQRRVTGYADPVISNQPPQ